MKVVQTDTLIFGTTDIRYVRSDMTHDQYWYPMLQILYLLCLQCNT